MVTPDSPAALSVARVPRSRLDALYESGTPLAANRIAVGTIVSVDSDDTCTVLISDDEVSGVVFQGSPPAVDELVEVEVRGDLLVIRPTPAVDDDTYVEGVNSNAAHIVAADTPPPPDPFEVNVGGSMRDTAAWYFLPPDSTVWASELDVSGVGIRAHQVAGATPGTLWSDATFPVSVGDQLAVVVDLAQLAGTAGTAQLCLCLTGVDSDPVLPGGDVQVVTFGAPLTVTGAVELTLTITVPASITTPTTGATLPERARLGIILTGDGTTDLTVASTEVVQTLSSWPVGSVWFDPDAASGGVLTTANTPQTATTPVTLPDPGTGFARSPSVNKAIFTAPPDSSGIVFAIGYLSVVTGSTPTVDIDFRLNSDTPNPISNPLMRVTQGAGQSIPVSVFANVPLDAGQTAEIWLEHRYPNAPGAATYSIRLAGIQLLFLPGAVRGGGFVTDPMVRYFDGDSWRPDLLRGPTIDTTQLGSVAPPAKIATTTTCTRTPGSGVVAGDKVTLSATVTPTAAGGTVTFSRSASSSGPWSVIGSATVAGGKATRNWTTTKGTWFFQAKYSGSPTYATSTGTSGSLVVAADKPQVQTKTVTIAAAWCQAYNGSGGQISGSGNDTAAHQGFYSSTHGNRKTLLGFTVSLPSDADVQTVELVCTGWEHWYDYSGGTLVAGWHQSSSAPATYPAGANTHEDQSRHGVDTGQWTVNLTSWGQDVVARSTFKGIVFGPGPSTSSQYYGYSASPGRSQFKLRITYKTFT